MSLLDFIEEGSVPVSIRFLYMVLYLIVFVIFINYTNKYSYDSYDNDNKKGYFFAILYTIFAVFYCVNSDYFSYRFWVENYEKISSYFSKEIVYMIIARLVKGDYELFRTIVWGGGIAITCMIAKLQRTNLYATLLIWFILYYSFFCYARASLGIGIFTLGVAMIAQNIGINRILVAVGFLVCLSSISFHRSLLIGVLTLPILFFEINKSRLVIFAILLVGIGSVLMGTVFDIQDFSTDENYSSAIQGYTEAINDGMYETNSISNIIKLLWKYSLFYHAFFLISKVLFREENYGYISNETISMYKVTAAVILLATAFGVEFGLGNVFFYRVLFMTAPMLSVVASRLWQDGLLSNANIRQLSYNAVAYYVVYFYINISSHSI